MLGIKKLSSLSLAIFACLAIGVSSASAAAIEIQFLGLDLQYNDDEVNGRYDVYDAMEHDGGSKLNSEADSLDSVGFYVDDVLQGSVFTGADNLYIDFRIEDINIPLATGSAVSGGNAGTFGLDLWSDPTGTGNGNGTGGGWHLQLAIDTVRAFHTGDGIFVTIGGAAASPIGVVSQDLPSGLAIDDTFEITFVISSASVEITGNNGTQITELTASGIGNIEGTLVPEPSSILLSMLGALGLLFFGIKNRRKNS